MSRKKRPLPPPNRVPQDVSGTRYYDVLEYGVCSWSPDPRGISAATQVHFQLVTRQLDPIVVRMKSAAAVDELIDALTRHRVDVFGPME